MLLVGGTRRNERVGLVVVCTQQCVTAWRYIRLNQGKSVSRRAGRLHNDCRGACAVRGAKVCMTPRWSHSHSL